MPKAGRTHHFTIKDRAAGTNTYGFMVPRGQNGSRQLTVNDAQTIQPRFWTQGELERAEFPPQVALTWYQGVGEGGWQGGIGGKTFKQNSKMLADSSFVDSSGTQGILQVQGKLVASDKDSGEDNPATGVPKSGFTAHGNQLWAFFGQRPYRWDFSNNKWDDSTTPAPYAKTSVVRGVVSFDGNHYAPRWADDAASPGSAISDEPSAYFYKATTDTAWTASTLTLTNYDAFKYFAVADNLLWGAYAISYADTANNNSGDAVNATQTSIVCSTTVNSNITAGSVIKFDGTNSQETLLVTAVSSATLTVVRGYRGTIGQTHPGNQNIYKLTSNVHHVHSTSDATNTGSWGGATEIGDSSSPITGMVGLDTDLIILKTDGLYRLESDGTVTELRPEMKTTIMPDQFRGAMAWNDRVFLPLHGGGLWELNTTDWSIRDISFKLVMPEQTQYHGTVAALSGSATRLYALVQDSSASKYYLLYAEWLGLEGTIDYRWHHMATTDAYETATDFRHAEILYEGIEGDAGTKQHDRVWLGMESTGTDYRYPYWVTVSSNDAAHLLTVTDAVATTVLMDWNWPNVDKRLQKIDFRMSDVGQASDPNSIEVEYRKDEGTWYHVTTGTASTGTALTSTTGSQTLTFSSEETCKTLELRFTLKHDADQAQSPKLLEFTVTAQFRPDSVKLIPARTIIHDDQILLNGAKESKVKLKLNQLRTWNDQSKEVTVEVADLPNATTTYQAVFMPGTFKYSEIGRSLGKRPSYVAEWAMIDVS